MPDLTAPLLSATTPASNATAVVLGANIVLTFSEAMTAGNGNIIISDGATQTYMGSNGALRTRLIGASDTRTVSISDTSQVTISGNTVTINLTSNLKGGLTYSVQMGGGVLTDLAGNNYTGLADTSRLKFSTILTPSAEVDSSIHFTDSGASSSDHISNVAAQTIGGTYSGILGANDFVEVSLDNGATWITATTTEKSWQASATFTASSAVLARVSNNVGGHSTAQSQAYTFDAAAPSVVSATLSDSNLVYGETSTYTITFSEKVPA